jgi:hypothetical protein
MQLDAVMYIGHTSVIKGGWEIPELSEGVWMMLDRFYIGFTSKFIELNWK